MVDQNSADNLFRFVQLRPRRTRDDVQPIPLDDSTSLARAFAKATGVAERAKLAEGVLAKLVPTVGDELALGLQVLGAASRLGQDVEATTEDLVSQVPAIRHLPVGEEGRARAEVLSDVLLASYFATRNIPDGLESLQAAYRVRFVPGDGMPPVLLGAFLRRPLLTHLVRTAPIPRRTSIDAGSEVIDQRAVVAAAIQEVIGLDRPGLLEVPSARGTQRRASTAFALSESAVAGLSSATGDVLAAGGLDPRSAPLETIVMQLVRAKDALGVRPIRWPFPVTPPEPGATLPPAPGAAVVSPAGVADLLVVKQQLKRYEGAELAHVENVLIGEKKARSHRQLDRSETTFLTETEVTGVKESELQTTDRFELNRETSQTIKSDVKSGFDLSLSGKYGPTVDFKASTSLSSTTSTEQSAKNSTRFAKDIVSRSLERVTTRVREQRTTTIISETEETNLHELTNSTQQHINGVYQFLDKIYESQVFNYGIREMFDFMIPEPASFLWYVAQNPNTDLALPPAPNDLRLVCPDSSALTEDLALALAAEYGADIDPAPVPYQLLAASFKHGDDNASEQDQPRSNQQADITVPAGYQVVRARFHGTAITDENPVVAVTIGSATPRIWRGGAAVNVSAGNRIIYTPQLAIPLDSEPHPMSGDNKLNVLLVAYETNTYAFEVVVVARATEALVGSWRLVTFGKLLAKYEDRLREYQQKVEQIKADAQAKAERDNTLPFGAPPAMNQATIAAELKKHCISVLTQQWYDAFDATKDGTPPTFDLVDAAAEGAYIRFFEQSFEWDQTQWVFYPYFWARKNTWIPRFLKQDADPQFQDFLRAGSARVVVPVRPGFEVTITHFLETGKLWGGEGEPPQINNPMYVSIVDEIRERTGAPQGEYPVGEPWETRVPTALLLVRPNSDLPTWTRASPDGWEWNEEP